jgi:hypothetical protein
MWQASGSGKSTRSERYIAREVVGMQKREAVVGYPMDTESAAKTMCTMLQGLRGNKYESYRTVEQDGKWVVLKKLEVGDNTMTEQQFENLVMIARSCLEEQESIEQVSDRMERQYGTIFGNTLMTIVVNEAIKRYNAEKPIDTSKSVYASDLTN